MAGTNAAVSNKTGTIYFSKISGITDIVEDTADAWDEQTVIGVVNSTTTSDGPSSTDLGAPSKNTVVARSVTTSVVAGLVIASEVIPSTDLSGQDAISIHFRSTVAVPAGDLLLILDDTALGASPLESIALPAYTGDNVGNWVTMKLKLANPSLDTAIISIGWQFAAAKTIDMTFDYFEVRQMREIQGMKNFSVPDTVDTLDESDYQSGTTREFSTSFTSWTMDFGGNKESSPPLQRSQSYQFAAQESDVVGRDFVGEGFYTSFTGTGSFDALVEYAFSIQGTGYLQLPLA